MSVSYNDQPYKERAIRHSDISLHINPCKSVIDSKSLYKVYLNMMDCILKQIKS